MATEIWVWTLSDFVTDTAKTSTRSPVFCRDGHYIYLKAVKEDDDLFFHVKLASKNLPPDIGFRLTKTITLLNRKDPNLSIVKPRKKDAKLYLSSSRTLWGCKYISLKDALNEDRGFLVDGAIMLEVQFFPVTSIKWQILSFRNLTQELLSPIFSLGGSDWQLVIHPKDSQDGPNVHVTHVSGYVRSVAVHAEPSLSLHASFSIACLDLEGNRKFELSRTNVFDANNNQAGTYQLIPLSALRSPSCWLPSGNLHIVAEISVNAIVWMLDWGANNGGFKESSTFSLGNREWKAVACASQDKKRNTFAVTSSETQQAYHGDFIIRPEFQISIAGKAAISADDRFQHNGCAYWGALTEPILEAGSHCEVKFAMVRKPSSVSWVIRNFRSFLSELWYPIPLHSGKILIGNDHVEMTIYPQGTGDGRFTHLSIFISLVRIGQQRVSRVVNMTFSVTRDHSTKYSASFTQEVCEEEPMGIAKFLPMDKVKDYLCNDGSLRLDASWDKPSVNSIDPSSQGIDIDVLDLLFGAEKQLRRILRLRELPLTDLEKAAEAMALWNATLNSWTLPHNISYCVDNAISCWDYLKRMQEEVRKCKLDVTATCSRRNEARRFFCAAAVELKGLKELEMLDELKQKNVATIPNLELEHPHQGKGAAGPTIKDGQAAVMRWWQWKVGWQPKRERAAMLTDNAARTMRESLRRLFDVDTNFICDKAQVRLHYSEVLDCIREEDIVLNENRPTFPVKPVIEVYYAIKQETISRKAKIQYLWNAKEKILAHFKDVQVWRADSPNLDTLKKREKRRNQLIHSRQKLDIALYELVTAGKGKNPLFAGQKEMIEHEMQSMTRTLQNVDESFQEEYRRLCEIRDHHFPEFEVPSGGFNHVVGFKLCGNASASEVESPSIDGPASTREIDTLLCEKRSLDMYRDRKGLHHRIIQATLWEQPCVLKKFTTQESLRREAWILSQLRHPAIVPLEGLFFENGGGYMQMPLYNCDLATWLRVKDNLQTEMLQNLICSILGVVTHIHHCGFVHGDLSSQNFLMDDATRLILCDFGSAVQIGKDSPPAIYVGSCGYTAPELIRFGALPTKASDVYSLGCILQKDLIPRCPKHNEYVDKVHQCAKSLCVRDANERPAAIDVFNSMITPSKSSDDHKRSSKLTSLRPSCSGKSSPNVPGRRSHEPEEEPRM